MNSANISTFTVTAIATVLDNDALYITKNKHSEVNKVGKSQKYAWVSCKDPFEDPFLVSTI